MKKILFLLLLSFCLSSAIKAQNNIRMVSYFDSKYNTAYYLAWDIKTGKNMQYYWADSKWNEMEVNIPASPLPGAVGNIMFEVYYDQKYESAYYICWDTKTGKSMQYYWGEGKWNQMEINLPASPLPGAKGDIIIRPYYDLKYESAYYMVYETSTGKSIQYYWADSKWNSMEINLPEAPVK